MFHRAKNKLRATSGWSLMQPMMMLRLLLGVFLAGSFSAIRADDDAQTSGDVRFFESKIRPILVKHCYECHSIDSGVSESGLRLDTREAVAAGGDRGPAIVAGKPQQSLLLQAIAHADPDLQMPPRVERLPAAVIADFKRWIERGAVDPRDSSTGCILERRCRNGILGLSATRSVTDTCGGSVGHAVVPIHDRPFRDSRAEPA